MVCCILLCLQYHTEKAYHLMYLESTMLMWLDTDLASSVLSWHDIKSMDLLPKKISSLLQPVKEDPGLRTLNVYSIPCKCCQVHIGWTGCSTNIKLKKHQCLIYLEHPHKSAVVGHGINIQLHNTWILSAKTRFIVGSLLSIMMNYNLCEAVWVSTHSTDIAHCLPHHFLSDIRYPPHYLLHLPATCLLNASVFQNPTSYIPLAPHINVFSNRCLHTPTKSLLPNGSPDEPMRAGAIPILLPSKPYTRITGIPASWLNA
jgi:hypothetical protein